MDTALIRSNLDNHIALLKCGDWPLQRSKGADLYLDIGADPSLSSSGMCVILRDTSGILELRTLRVKTSPQDPVPLRLLTIVDSLKHLIQDILQGHVYHHLHITFLFEEPPTMMSSSGWLYALNQTLWLGFSSFLDLNLCPQGNVTFNQLAINVSQFKAVYLNRSDFYGLSFSFADIKKSKKTLKNIISRTLEDIPSVQSLLPKKFNHDVAESVFLACCAGACSTFDSFVNSSEHPIYTSIPVKQLHAFMTNTAVNKHRERLGWVYRPLEHSFGWAHPCPN